MSPATNLYVVGWVAYNDSSSSTGRASNTRIWGWEDAGRLVRNGAMVDNTVHGEPGARGYCVTAPRVERVTARIEPDEFVFEVVGSDPLRRETLALPPEMDTLDLRPVVRLINFDASLVTYSGSMGGLPPK
eukprot:m.2851 g.2851  ORF g.2851 m.2851 type:complete len:131 (+) comp1267_c0_seq1:331-723(+)